MNHENFHINESTDYSNSEYPHYLSMHVYFKTKKDRETFKRAIKKLIWGHSG